MSKAEPGSEAHVNATREGMRRATEQREKWLKSVHKGEISFSEMVEISRNNDYKAIGNLRLALILGGRPGWTEGSAHEALAHQGFGPKDTIKSIRRSRANINLVETLMNTEGRSRWRPAPKLPDGWPWFGRLSAVFEDHEVDHPDELAALLGLSEDDDGDTEEDEHRNSQDQEDALAALLADDDEGS